MAATLRNPNEFDLLFFMPGLRKHECGHMQSDAHGQSKTCPTDLFFNR